MTREELLHLAAPQYDEVPVLVLDSAIDYATKKHAGQKRKSGEPYITHPLAVAGILVEWGMDIDTVIAGVLHDTVEDTDATLDELESLFGRDIAFLVDGVTKVSQARAGMRSLDSYLPHTKDNLAKLMIAVGEDIRVIIIKLADRLHNMRTLQYMPRDKQKKIARETIEVFAPLADRLNMGRVRVQLEELSFRFLMPKDFQRTKSLMDSRLKKSQRKLAKVRRDVTARLQNESLQFEMDGRVKSVYSLFKKLDRVGDIDKIYDLIALRIIVDDLATGYLVLGVLHEMYQPFYERIKDYVANPKPNGYQSLHTTIQTPTGQIVEFQIRTRDMHEYAERGLRLIEVDKSDLISLPALLTLLSERPEKFIVFCDDLSFETGDETYKALKTALDGGLSQRCTNVLVYATSNRRHLIPEYMDENGGTTGTRGEIHQKEAVEEKISLSDRFGLWLSFYPFDQNDYLTAVANWLDDFNVPFDDTARQAALQWAQMRGSRSGRTAYQFACDWAGRLPDERKVFE